MLPSPSSTKRIIRALLGRVPKPLRGKRAGGARLRRQHPTPPKARGLRRTRELVSEERISGGVLRQAAEVRAGGVHERARRRVLRGDAQVADVAERVLAFARRQQRVQPRHVRVLRLRGLGTGLCLRRRRLVRCDRVEGARRFGLLQRVERGLEPRLGARWSLERGCEGVVGAGWLGFDVLALQ